MSELLSVDESEPRVTFPPADDDPEPHVSAFDELGHLRQLATHHRGRIKGLERRVAFLEQSQRHTFRVLGLTLLLAAGDSQDVALLLLRAIDEAVTAEASIERIVQVLRETDPDPEPRVRAA